MSRSALLLAFVALLQHAVAAPCNASDVVGFYNVKCDADGGLIPVSDPLETLKREMEWYHKCPNEERGYPVFLTSVFMNGKYQPTDIQVLPGMTHGMGLISYVKYYLLTNKTDAKALARAHTIANMALKELVTGATGKWPSYFWPSGVNLVFPVVCCAQADIIYAGCDTIEPDKGAMVGVGLLLLHAVSPEQRYLNAAIHVAQVLSSNLNRSANAEIAPWSFRVNFKTGQTFMPKSANTVFPLRLFDMLIEQHGQSQFQTTRDFLWRWIVTFQFPSINWPRNQTLWVNFFEDKTDTNERVSWPTLEMARYLLERKDKLDPNWMARATELIQWSLALFSHQRPYNVTVMGEQDSDQKPWGGANSKLISVAALYASAFPPGAQRQYYLNMSRRLLSWWTYYVDVDGCPAAKEDGVSKESDRGGWQEDAHTDVVHNVVDALVLLKQML